MFIKMEKNIDNVKQDSIDNLKSDKLNGSSSEDGQASESSQVEQARDDLTSMNVNKKIKGVESHKKEKTLYEEIVIPEGLSALIVDDVLSIKKDDKEIKRVLTPLISVKVEDGKVVISSRKMRRTERRLFGTFKAHVKNMIKGLNEGFVYKLQVANVHFPMNVSYDKATNELVVKNFLGEKKDRRIKLGKDVDVKVDGENIEVSSYDIEKAGDAATKIEKGTKVRDRDRRVYQDGIFITEKPGRVYL